MTVALLTPELDGSTTMWRHRVEYGCGRNLSCTPRANLERAGKSVARGDRVCVMSGWTIRGHAARSAPSFSQFFIRTPSLESFFARDDHPRVN
jgi:hypothetical protein